MAEALVLLGSNIEPVHNTRQAVRLLHALFDVRAVSTAWETAAVGSNGPNFINVAVKIETNASPAQLKAECLRRMEHRLGRVRTNDKNGPRTIDLDVIVYDHVVLDPALWNQAHIAIPVADLAPGLIEPISRRTLEEIARAFQESGSVIARTDLCR